jgi:hypothetical protein
MPDSKVLCRITISIQTLFFHSLLNLQRNILRVPAALFVQPVPNHATAAQLRLPAGYEEALTILFVATHITVPFGNGRPRFSEHLAHPPLASAHQAGYPNDGLARNVQLHGAPRTPLGRGELFALGPLPVTPDRHLPFFGRSSSGSS